MIEVKSTFYTMLTFDEFRYDSYLLSDAALTY